MKEGIHPKYEDITATCSCGNVIKTRSTPASRRLWTPVVVSIASRSVSAAVSVARKTDPRRDVEKAPLGAFFVRQ